jgi:hypothetical protein
MIPLSDTKNMAFRSERCARRLKKNPGWNETMKASKTTSGFGIIAVAVCMLGMNTGCQVQVAGQTLPSAYYIEDDVQYFPAGSENKLANETAALKAEREEARARR